jgi:hypothetical protein
VIPAFNRDFSRRQLLVRGAKKLSRHSYTVKNEIFSVLKARVSDKSEGNWRPQW